LDRYRPSKSREFFALPVDEAVGVLNRVADEVGRVQKADDAKPVVDDQAPSGPSRPLPEITVVSPEQQRKKSGNARRTAVTFDDHASYTDAPTRPILGELRRRVLALDKHLQDGEVCTPNHRIAYNVPGHKIFLEVKVQRAAIVLHLIEGNLPDPTGITSPIPASHGWGDLKKRIKLSPGGIKLDAGWPFVEAAYRAHDKPTVIGRCGSV
jgi:hypothetical protein